jgi:phosphatidylethanolamine-binding protein (PEBP) family uncharacterized protein
VNHKAFLPILFGLGTAFSAASQEKFGAAIDWSRVPRCSAVSPEISLKGIPVDATQFRVTLFDRDAPGYRHGGGEAANDGSGVIKQGAIKGNYDGPCPPYTHTYVFTITARNKNGDKLAETEVVGDFPVTQK